MIPGARQFFSMKGAAPMKQIVLTQSCENCKQLTDHIIALCASEGITNAMCSVVASEARNNLVGIAAIVWLICLAQGIYHAITAVAGASDLAVMEVWTPVLQFINVYLWSRWYFSVRSLEKGKKPRRFHYLAYLIIALAAIIVSMASIILKY